VARSDDSSNKTGDNKNETANLADERTCGEPVRRPFAGEDRAELKRSERTVQPKYINYGGFLEAVSHVGSWPMSEFVDATRMHVLGTRNHRGVKPMTLRRSELAPQRCCLVTQ